MKWSFPLFTSCASVAATWAFRAGGGWVQGGGDTGRSNARPSATSPLDGMGGGDEEMQMLYLGRIGFAGEDAAAWIGRERAPSLGDLQRLFSAHLLAVPFENMDQHSHPACPPEANAVPRKGADELPSLDVARSLDKICRRGRGGFCFELNFSFCWLLRSLGYDARLLLADVGCSQDVPAHVVILVDGLKPENGSHPPATPVLVDVGFGNPGVCEIVLPVVHDNPLQDPHGDSFWFSASTENPRFDTALYRRRVSTGDDEPMYRFLASDNLSFDSEEFVAGLRRVLTTSELFTTNRICVLSTDRGHVTLAEGYVKWVEKGEVVRQVELPTETAWRSALEEHFGVKLEHDEVCP